MMANQQKSLSMNPPFVSSNSSSANPNEAQCNKDRKGASAEQLVLELSNPDLRKSMLDLSKFFRDYFARACLMDGHYHCKGASSCFITFNINLTSDSAEHVLQKFHLLEPDLRIDGKACAVGYLGEEEGYVEVMKTMKRCSRGETYFKENI